MGADHIPSSPQYPRYAMRVVAAPGTGSRCTSRLRGAGVHVPALSRYRRRTSRSPLPSSRWSPPAGPSSGTSPVPVENILHGIRDGPARAPRHPSPVPVAGGTPCTPFRPPSHVLLVGLRRIRRRRRRRRPALQPLSGGIPGRQVRFSLLPRGSRRGLPPAPCRDVLRVLAPPSRREASLPPTPGYFTFVPDGPGERSPSCTPARPPGDVPSSPSRYGRPLRYDVPDPWRARDSVMLTAPVPPRALPDAAGGPLRAPPPRRLPHVLVPERT